MHGSKPEMGQKGALLLHSRLSSLEADAETEHGERDVFSRSIHVQRRKRKQAWMRGNW